MAPGGVRRHCTAAANGIHAGWSDVHLQQHDMAQAPAQKMAPGHTAGAGLKTPYTSPGHPGRFKSLRTPLRWQGFARAGIHDAECRRQTVIGTTHS